MKFKLFFPAGYNVLNIYDDNIDVNIITEDNFVHFVTMFTVDNIKSILERGNDIWFWATDMLVVKDLDIVTIIKTIEGVIKEGSLGVITSKIGDIEGVFGTSEHCNILKNWEDGFPKIV